MELEKLTALQLGEKIKQRQVSVLDGVKTVFEQIEKQDSEVHAYLDTYKEEAYKRAEEVQKGIEDGTYTSPLAGVPIAIKDNICINGKKTTCASKILENFVPQYNAEVIDRLERAGLVIIGKTNMDEFAMGSTTETSAYGITRNPWNLEHVPGGSSGGSCAAVAAGETYLALGSDTGGSIRQPSSYCGVTGIKPTYGTVSRYGLVAYASSLDQIGPVGKDVSDCAALLEIIAGHDTKDSTSMKREDLQFSKELTGDIRGSGYYDAYYLKALRTKALIKKEFDQAFGKYDVLLAPASPFTAPKIGESLKDPLAMYLGDIYTVAVNLCGLPGITVPCGKDSKGLPIGIQMIGDCFMEKKILRAAHAYETSRGSFAVPGEGGTR